MQRLLKSAGLLAFLLASAETALAQYAPTYDLTGMNGSNGFRLDGQQTDRRTGNTLADAGDINGDGYGDLLVGAPLARAGGNTEAGEIAVIFGKKGAYPATSTSAVLNGKNGFRLVGFTPKMQAGLTLSSAGDFNGDGCDDILIGAPNASPNGRAGAGMTFLLLGRKGGFPATVHLDDFDGLAGLRLDGVNAGDKLGSSLTGGVDLDADGFGDIVLGAAGFDPTPGLHNAGAAYVVYGRPGKLPAKLRLDLLGANGVSRINGEVHDGALGQSVAATGDFDGNGMNDIVLGAPYYNTSVTQYGRIYAVFGSNIRLDAAMNVWDLNGANGFAVSGSRNFELFGWSVAGAGDVNGDGYRDVVIGSPGFSLEPSSSEGAAYVLFGKSNFEAQNNATDLISAGLLRRFTGSFAGDVAGSTVAGGGDVNGDGFSDVLIGAPGADVTPSGINAGSAFLIFGRASGYRASTTLANLDGTNGVWIAATGAPFASAFASTGLAMLGDMNRDGLAELAVGAPQASVGTNSRAGTAFVVNGLGPVDPVRRDAWLTDAIILGGPSQDTLVGSFGEDVLEGRGGADELNGSFLGNTASYEHAAEPVTASLAAPSINTGEAAGDSYSNIVGLRGSWFNDKLAGNGGPNGIAGLRGRDVMSGGGGVTTYFYFDVRESRPGDKNRDVITDFNAGTPTSEVDRILLFTIDAQTGVDGHQMFRWIGTRPFSHHKGELRVARIDGKVLAQADVTGDGKADFEIHFANLASTRNLDPTDFLTNPNL